MRYPPIRYDHRWGHPGRLGWFGGLLGLVFLAGLIALVVALVLWLFDRRLRSHPTSPVQPPSRPDDAIAALRMRYARGEIRRDEYTRTAADLGMFVPPAQGATDAPPPPPAAGPPPAAAPPAAPPGSPA